MNDIKVFITVDMVKGDVIEDEVSHINIIPDSLVIILDNVLDMIKEDVPVQFKITNLPPRRSGFVKASDLITQ